jgi:hypothetical protein
VHLRGREPAGKSPAIEPGVWWCFRIPEAIVDNIVGYVMVFHGYSWLFHLYSGIFMKIHEKSWFFMESYE